MNLKRSNVIRGNFFCIEFFFLQKISSQWPFLYTERGVNNFKFLRGEGERKSRFNFNNSSLLGIWQHLDSARGFTNMQQKVSVMKQLGKAHFPDLYPHFAQRLDYLNEHATRHSL